MQPFGFFFVSRLNSFFFAQNLWIKIKNNRRVKLMSVNVNVNRERGKCVKCQLCAHVVVSFWWQPAQAVILNVRHVFGPNSDKWSSKLIDFQLKFCHSSERKECIFPKILRHSTRFHCADSACLFCSFTAFNDWISIKIAALDSFNDQRRGKERRISKKASNLIQTKWNHCHC